MGSPIDLILDGVVWKAAEGTATASDGLPVATHEGILEWMGHSIRVYRLSDGRAVFHADDLEKFFDFRSHPMTARERGGKV
jgi:hypothetical protein